MRVTRAPQNNRVKQTKSALAPRVAAFAAYAGRWTDLRGDRT